jgi:phage terminase small subunit
MGDRGRTPAAAMSVAANNVNALPARPEPPADLTEIQQAEWRRVVANMPADWFRPETLTLLAEYCKHCETAAHLERVMRRKLSEGIEVDLKELKTLQSMCKEESAIITALMRSMRLTQQSTFDKERKKDKLGSRPWQIS